MPKVKPNAPILAGGAAAKKKKKKKKDPNAPKRPLTAYMIWLNKGGGRSEMKAKYPDANATEIAKKCGAQWKNMSEKQKKKYIDQADKLKSAYKKVKAEYDAKQKKSAKPKRPPTAFFVFSAARRPSIKKDEPDLKVTDIAKRLGAEWKSLDAKGKEKYEKKAATAKAKYVKELDKWNKKQARQQD